ncbi:Lactonase, 7-bladed beta-propeller-domain-containing protein [Thelonectria olida]|uniref:Lactonase, 7-bladed beta-propeller-domain-containing protein n=1 Tax=Thelonectria olida TaxID=1576542 RepID=A0A9P8WAG1_9HYPO|nr:Lactonase, 7-bladed beta-propeller-domain-containing protein [Thelonectria olida]
MAAKSLPQPAVAHRARFKDQSARTLLPVILLSLPIFGLLFHCAYHSYHGSHHHGTDLIHGLGSIDSIDADESLSSSASNVFLYVASYGGSVTTLKITRGGDGVHLRPVATTEGCAGSPSWLTLDSANDVLYCTDEGLSLTAGDGSLSSFRTISDGSLVRLERLRTVAGPVSAVLYGKDGNGLAVAHYGGSALTSWDIKDPENIKSVQTRLFKLSQPGPDPSRQEASHPHAAAVDPKGKFVLVPDLGADLVRIYATNEDDLNLQEREPLVVAPGSGPRHVAFADKGKKTFMYLVTELGNTVVGYEVTYDDDDIAFEQIWSSGIHGKDRKVPKGAAASEIAISPDSNFLILASRSENHLSIPNPNPTNKTQITSDPLINFSIDSKTGDLELLQEVPCGGRVPRQFSVNQAGDLVAVALQNDGRVAVIERDVQTGVLGEIVAYADIEGEVTTVIFNE